MREKQGALEGWDTTPLVSPLTSTSRIGYSPRLGSHRLSYFRTALISLILFSTGICLAKPPFFKVFTATYKPKPNSKLAKARCLTCHQPPGPPNRNPYGKQVKAALEAAHARMVTPEILHSIEQKDAGDGVPFITKIKKGLPPGAVAKSRAGKPRKSKPKHKK